MLVIKRLDCKSLKYNISNGSNLWKQQERIVLADICLSNYGIHNISVLHISFGLNYCLETQAVFQ